MQDLYGRFIQNYQSLSYFWCVGSTTALKVGNKAGNVPLLPAHITARERTLLDFPGLRQVQCCNSSRHSGYLPGVWPSFCLPCTFILGLKSPEHDAGKIMPLEQPKRGRLCIDLLLICPDSITILFATRALQRGEAESSCPHNNPRVTVSAEGRKALQLYVNAIPGLRQEIVYM